MAQVIFELNMLSYKPRFVVINLTKDTDFALIEGTDTCTNIKICQELLTVKGSLQEVLKLINEAIEPVAS